MLGLSHPVEDRAGFRSSTSRPCSTVTLSVQEKKESTKFTDSAEGKKLLDSVTKEGAAISEKVRDSRRCPMSRQRGVGIEYCCGWSCDALERLVWWPM